MPAGRPTKYDPAYCEEVIDRETIIANKYGVSIKSRPKLGNEKIWCAELMDGYDRWRDIVSCKTATKIEIEKCITPDKAGKRFNGFCRADAIIWHSETECSILEAKVDCSVSAICGGIGQLMYYRTAIQAYWNVKVDSLILAAPQLPPLILDTIAGFEAPIKFIKRDMDDNLSGLVPSYG